MAASKELGSVCEKPFYGEKNDCTVVFEICAFSVSCLRISENDQLLYNFLENLPS